MVLRRKAMGVSLVDSESDKRRGVILSADVDGRRTKSEKGVTTGPLTHEMEAESEGLAWVFNAI